MRAVPIHGRLQVLPLLFAIGSVQPRCAAITPQAPTTQLQTLSPLNDEAMKVRRVACYRTANDPPA